MIAIGYRFLTGRFHTTPWGRHVNEGIPEWPPSPWRMLRSLVATWKIKTSEYSNDEVRPIIEALLPLPQFALPSASTGHSRHYMRWYKKSPVDQTLVFDAFVCVNRNDEVIALWPDSNLDGNQRSVLSTILANLAYFGRAESWCEARLLDETETSQIVPNCFPLNGEALNKNQELVRVLCVDPEQALLDEHVSNWITIGKGKNKQKIKQSLYDPSWHLCMETAQLHKEGWSDPPGSQWIRYIRAIDCLTPVVKKISAPKQHLPIQVARYALDSTVLPLLQDALPVAEAARRALMGKYGIIQWKQEHPNEELPASSERPKSEMFSGKDEKGTPLTGHVHSYYIPTDEDGDGRLDHLTIYCQQGFERGSSELSAFDKLRTIKLFDESAPLRVLLLGIGNANDYAPYPLQASRHWVSATPFIATRHPKAKGKKRDSNEMLHSPLAFLTQVLREELTRFPLDEDVEKCQELIDSAMISPIIDTNSNFVISPKRWMKQTSANSRTIRPIQFKKHRMRKVKEFSLLSGSFQITFSEEVKGPIVLGKNSHFGMGLFLPCNHDPEQ